MTESLDRRDLLAWAALAALGAVSEVRADESAKPALERVERQAPLGRTLDIDALRALFQTAGGTKPGFRIELSELRGIALHSQGATLSYREQQTDASGVHTDRRSTVVFERTEAGRVLWRHLHETFCQG